MNYKEFRKDLQEIGLDREDIKEAIQYVSSDNNYNDFHIGGGQWDYTEWRFIHKDDIVDIYYDEMVDLIKQCHKIDVPDFVVIDWDKTVENCMIDGYGHHFSHYDGSENHSSGYYIFRVN